MLQPNVLLDDVIDLQMVNIGLRVLHRPDMTQLPAVYRNLGKDYDDRVLPSIMNEVRAV